MSATDEYSTSYLAENQGPVLLKVAISVIVLDTVFLILYTISRLMNRSFKGWDVYFMLVTYVFVMTDAAMAFVAVIYAGAGRHVAAVGPDAVEFWLKCAIPEAYIHPSAIMFSKLSILCFYLRVFPLQIYRYVIYAIQLAVIATAVAAMIGILVICQPIAFLWDPDIPDGHCGDLLAFSRYPSIPHVVTDLCMLVLPLYAIWHLQIKIANKIGLSLVFLAGCMGIVIAVARMIMWFQAELFEDVTYNLASAKSWAVCEEATYMLAGTLPSLGPLVRYVIREIQVRSSSEQIGGHISRVFSIKKNRAASSEKELNSTELTTSSSSVLVRMDIEQISEHQSTEKKVADIV